MLPQGVEVRPDLQVNNGVSALGFSGAKVADAVFVDRLGGDFLDYVEKDTESSPARVVVLDMRNVSYLSSAGIGRLLTLSKRLDQADRRLVLVVSDQVIRGVFSLAGLDQVMFQLVANDAELRALFNREPLALAPGQPEIEFTESELAEMEAGGLTLEDAVLAIEQLRE